MPRSTLSAGDRSRGALIGLALGQVLGSTQGLTTWAGPGPFPREDTPTSPHADPVARALILGEELLEEAVDLERVAERWVEWYRRDGRGVGSAAAEALEHLARWHSPLREGGGSSLPLAVCIPIGLAAWSQSRSLLTGTYHTALLVDPDPTAAWAAVAVNVALAEFLHNRRDFVGDVIAALQANDAAPEVLSVARRVPLLRREDLDLAGADGRAISALEVALFAAYHIRSWERALEWIGEAGRPAGTIGATVGALLGARDGEQAIPAAWTAEVPEPGRVRGVAKRLVAPRERGVPASG